MDTRGHLAPLPVDRSSAGTLTAAKPPGFEAMNHWETPSTKKKRKKPIMKNRSFPAITLVFLIACLSSSAGASHWRLRAGLNDVYVPKEESHTRGAHAAFVYDREMASGLSLFASLDVLADSDNDELDPDHVPVWFMSEFSAQKQLVEWGKRGSLNFIGEFSGRRNTVSSVEIGIKAMPGIKAAFDGDKLYGGLKLLAGFYMLEIDDDVPEPRGYGRGDLNHSTFAGSLGGDARVDLGHHFVLYGSAQSWWNADDWLESQFAFKVIYDSGSLIRGSTIALHVERNQWNLDPYAILPLDDPDYLPVLPWDKDRFARIYIEFPLGRKAKSEKR